MLVSGNDEFNQITFVGVMGLIQPSLREYDNGIESYRFIKSIKSLALF